MRHICSAIVLAALLSAEVNAAGFATSANFIVIVPAKPSQEKGDRFARIVLEQAEQFRAAVAKEWLGKELPEGGVRTIINVNYSNQENSGLTWAKDDPARKFHNVYLTTSPTKASGSMLHHEIAHTVFATQFIHPNRLPSWVEEGIACRYDDKSLIASREQEVRTWIRTGQLPQLIALLDAPGIASFDDVQYAAAESLVDFLVSRGDKPTVIRFADEGRRDGWNAALRNCYQIDDVRQLQLAWQDWLRNAKR